MGSKTTQSAAEFTKLSQEIKKNKEENTNLNQIIESLHLSINEKDKSISELTANLKTANIDSDNANKNIASLEKKQEELTQELEKLADHKKHNLELIAKLNKTISQQKQDSEQLRAQLDTVRNESILESTRLKKSIENHKQTLAKAVAALKILQKNAEEIKSENSELSESFNTLKTDWENLKEKASIPKVKSHIKKKITTFITTYKSFVVQKVESLEQSLQALNTEHEEFKNLTSNQVEAMKTQSQRLQETILTSLQAKMQEHNNKITAKEQRCLQLLSDLTAVKTGIESKKSQIASLHGTIDLMREDNETMQTPFQIVYTR